jgi:hypothetical protein
MVQVWRRPGGGSGSAPHHSRAAARPERQGSLNLLSLRVCWTGVGRPSRLDHDVIEHLRMRKVGECQARAPLSATPRKRGIVGRYHSCEGCALARDPPVEPEDDGREVMPRFRVCTASLARCGAPGTTGLAQSSLAQGVLDRRWPSFEARSRCDRAPQDEEGGECHEPLRRGNRSIFFGSGCAGLVLAVLRGSGFALAPQDEEGEECHEPLRRGNRLTPPPQDKDGGECHGLSEPALQQTVGTRQLSCWRTTATAT